MRRTLSGIAIMTIWAAAAGAQSPPTPTAAAPAATPSASSREATPTPGVKPPFAEVSGTIPDSLAGTWLAVLELEMNPLPGNPKPTPHPSNSARIYRIASERGQWRVEELTMKLPAALTTAIAEANKKGEKMLPGADVLKAVHAAAAKAKTASRTGRILLFTADHLPADYKGTPPPDVQLTLGFLGRDSRGLLGGINYQATEVAPDRIAGRVSVGNILRMSRTYVVPFGMHGQFVMYRVP